MSILIRFAAIALLLPTFAFASEAGVPLDHIETDHTNLPSLQRGAAMFANYCQGCHGLKYQRYNRTAKDLGIPEDLFKANLIFDGAPIGSHITSAMPADGAKNWFGAQPPDLTMETRFRGADWVYTYLRSFYLDSSRPLGVNNTVLVNAGMPDVLMELQGVPHRTCDGDGENAHCTIEIQEGTGMMSSAEFDKAVYDLVNYMDYTAEPYRVDRERIGVYVILFLMVLFVFTWLLGREYGKEVH